MTHRIAIIICNFFGTAQVNGCTQPSTSTSSTAQHLAQILFQHWQAEAR